MKVYKMINDQEKIISDIQPGTGKTIYKHQIFHKKWIPCWKCEVVANPKLIEKCPLYGKLTTMKSEELEKEKWGPMYKSPLVQDIIKRNKKKK